MAEQNLGPLFRLPNAMYGVGDPFGKAINALHPSNSNWGLREDGTKKGLGWLGPIQRPGGGFSSELSAGVNINGRETLIPLMVPTLNQQEVSWLLNTEPGPGYFQKMPPSILQKAVDFATQRIKLGQSPFID